MRMDFQEIRYEVVERVAAVTLDRPGRLNAFTRRVRDEPIEAPELSDGANHPTRAREPYSRRMLAMGAAADAAEGIAAFKEKRAPRFPMRPSRDMPAFYPWWKERPFE